MGPIVINGSVHTAHKQDQRKNVPICVARPVWIRPKSVYSDQKQNWCAKSADFQTQILFQKKNIFKSQIYSEEQ